MLRFSVAGVAPAVLGSVAVAAVLASVLVLPVEAKTTRTFSGSNPGEVEKNARQAGYDYPDGEMKCSSRCNQRWGKD